jgi:hypothetical protein
MVKRLYLFEVRTGFLNIIYMSFGFKELNIVRLSLLSSKSKKIQGNGHITQNVSILFREFYTEVSYGFGNECNF